MSDSIEDMTPEMDAWLRQWKKVLNTKADTDICPQVDDEDSAEEPSDKTKN